MFIKMGLKKTLLISGLIILVFSVLLVLPILHVLAIDEFIDDYENEDFVATKNNIIRNTTFDAMELDKSPFFIYTDNIIQVKEHKCYLTTSPSWLFSKVDGGENLEQYSITSSMGKGYFMIVVDRNWIDGKYLRFNWDGACNYYRAYAHAYVYDGSYDRSNATQFPNAAEKSLIGNGLLQTLVDVPAAQNWARTDDVLINVSSGVMDNVTIFWQLNDEWNYAWVRFTTNWVEFNTGSGGSGNLFTEQFNGTLTMEVTGTWNDYGYVDSVILPYTSGGYYETGQFYTTELLTGVNGIILVLLTNSTLDGAITVEFSDDNNTWVNHNNVSGSDNLVDGFESIDLRDLNYSSIYMRYNFTRGGIGLTPRLYQIRLHTTAIINYPDIDVIAFNDTSASGIIRVLMKASDVEGLSEYHYIENSTGFVIVSPPFPLTGVSDSVNITITSPDVSTEFYVRFYVKDTDGNQDVGAETIIVTTFIPPIVNYPNVDILELNTTTAEQLCGFKGEFFDIEGLSGYILWDNVTNPPIGQNSSWVALFGTSDIALENITLPITDVKVGVTYYVNDTDNNWAYETMLIFPTASVGNGDGNMGFNLLWWFVIFPPLILFIALVYRRRGRR